MARRVGSASTYRHLKRIGLGSLLFWLSIFCLWVTFNALFMVPGKYDAAAVSFAIIALSLAFGFAFVSGKHFIGSATKSGQTVFSTMPMVVWFVVVFVFACLLLSKFLDSR